MYDELDGEIDELLDEWMSDGADAFLLRGVRSLMQAGQQVFRRMPALGATQGPRVEQLLRTRGGVLLEGATPDQAGAGPSMARAATAPTSRTWRRTATGRRARWASRTSTSRAAPSPRGRSGHIYFGTPPQTWFDAPY